jgi:predicted nucleic-acid-binding protein
LSWRLVVKTLDTNVVVRLLIGDDPQQTPIAEQAFLAAIPSGGVYLPDVVLAEVAWVLRGYDLERATRYQLLERLVRTRGVVVDDIDAVIDALEQFRLGGDLADQLILARAASTGALPVLSFDRRFAASEGVELLGPA